MDQNQTPKGASNVIQFPGRKKDADKSPTPAPSPAPQKPAKKSQKKIQAATILAVMLMSVAVNRYVFDSSSTQMDIASQSTTGRSIASVERGTTARNPEWEKALAEQLASAKVRGIASVGVGRAPTREEQLRWGVLEEKYTITYNQEPHSIRNIEFQSDSTEPSYLLDRRAFLTEYGSLFEQHFDSAELKSVQSEGDRTIESYTLFDKMQNRRSEARIELDRHQRLISIKVEPVQI